ncbi:MAG: hypothetical protein ACPLRZ_06720 [Thermovenabulum sp.]|uniref:hypothetical protein n=1 Tax=Thermovenabulum sp. TaxID=3100335 RepID=UPI003C7C0EE1
MEKNDLQNKDEAKEEKRAKLLVKEVAIVYNVHNLSQDLETININLENFVNGMQENFNQISKTIKEVHDNLRGTISNIENDLKQLELEISQNNGTIAKLLASSNQKLQQEQVSKRRIDILNELSDVEKKIDNLNKDFSNLTQYLLDNLKNQMISYKDIENKLKTGLGQMDIPVFMSNPSNPILNVHQSIQTALETLNQIQANIAQNKLLSEINNTLENYMH